MEVPFEMIKGVKEFITPFKSKTEKEILEYSLMTDDLNLIFRNVCKSLKVPEDLPYEHKLAWIYKTREISFGSDFQIQYKCPSCGRYMENVILLEDLLEYPVWDKLPEDLKSIKLLDGVTVRDLVTLKVSDLPRVTNAKFNSLQDATKIMIALKSKVPRLKKTKTTNCFCGYKKTIDLTKSGFCINSLSTHTMLSMIQAYHVLVMNGFTKLDVDSMFPYEREIHLDLLKQRTTEIKESMKAP